MKSREPHDSEELITEYEQLFDQLLALNTLNLEIYERLNNPNQTIQTLTTIHINTTTERMDFNYNSTTIQLDFLNFFSKITNVFNDKLPTPQEPYFDMKSCITKFSLLNMTKSMPYLKEWKEALESVQCELGKIESQVNDTQQFLKEVIKIMKVDYDGSVILSRAFLFKRKEGSTVRDLAVQCEIDMSQKDGLTRLAEVMTLIHLNWTVNILNHYIELKLDPKTIKGDLTVNADEISIAKESTTHSCVSATTKITEGIHTWKVTLLTPTKKNNSAAAARLLIGVLSRPTAKNQYSHSSTYCYGVMVSNGNYNYELLAGKYKRNPGKYMIEMGDIVTVNLNMDEHKLQIRHEKWESDIDLPRYIQAWYPHFNVQTLLFKLN